MIATSSSSVDNAQISRHESPSLAHLSITSETTMNVIDRPVSAVGFARLTSTADALHALLLKRADKLEGFIEGSVEEAEFASIADALVAYEEQRWPSGNVPGGKG